MHRIATILYTLVGLFLVGFGILYATVDDYLFFHAAALPESVRPQARELYFALMQLIGGASAGLGLLGLWVTHGPMRRGMPGAAAAVAVAWVLAFAVAGYTATVLAARTGAPVAWYNMAILSALTLAGCAADRAARRRARNGMAALAPA